MVIKNGFEIRDSLISGKIRLPVKPGMKLIPGTIVKISNYNNNVVVDICDGENPFGLIKNKVINLNDYIDFSLMCEIHFHRMVLDTVRFDRKNYIEIGSSLYCNDKGLLTSKKPRDNSLILAKVISPSRGEKKHMTIFWL